MSIQIMCSLFFLLRRQKQATTTPANPCSPNPCVRGSCFTGSGNFFCLCPSEFTGLHCETDITTTSSTTTQTTQAKTVITTSMPTSTSRATATTTSGGDVCLACTDSPVTRECLHTMTCASHESCYADAFENPNGDLVFNLGCRDRQLCGSFGKRLVVNRSNGNTRMCAQCCLGNLCNNALCGQTGLPFGGPVCFQCDQANTPSSCNTIALCGRDDVCHVEKTIGSLTQATLYKSGCLHKTGNDLQIQCCDSNLCNHGNGSSASGSASTTGAVAPTHSSLSTQQSTCSTNPCIHGSCFSGSTDYFCQCEQGWQGKNCDQHQGPCTGSPCVHGNCFERSTDYVCQCENGWQGKNCDHKINHCASNPCVHGTCVDGASSYVCTCTVGWQGTNCDQAFTPTDCSDLLSQYSTVQSGVYTILTPLSHTTIQVYCDMSTDGGGWTIFQKRFNGKEDFNRNFRDYENGFGDVTAEYWLGVQHIQEITSAGSYKLRFDVTRFNGSTGYNVYGDFSLQPGPKYALNVGARLHMSGIDARFRLYYDPPYDALNTAGCAFSTFDHDADTRNGSCAAEYTGGWWYKNCYIINLNGRYLPGSSDTKAMRVFFSEGLSASSMMFKKNITDLDNNDINTFRSNCICVNIVSK